MDLFGRKKMYKKGMAYAMQAYEAFGKKQEAALEKIREEIRSGNKTLEAAISALGDDILAVYDYLNKQEKNALYKLATPMDIKDLEDAEQRLLLAVLYQLADDEGSRYNENQKKYINSIRKYLGITNIQTMADYSVIENIDSLDVQKVFMRIALEFMYLQDADEMSDDQAEFFDNFSVNKRQARPIEFEVIRQFGLLGVEGMAEKYGEAEVVEESVEETENPNNTKINMSLEMIERLMSSHLRVRVRDNKFETKNYYVVETIVMPRNENEWKKEWKKEWIKFSKTTKEEKKISFPEFRYIGAICDEDLLVLADKNTVYEYNISDESMRLISDELNILPSGGWGNPPKIVANHKWIVIYTGGDSFCSKYMYVVNRQDGSVIKQHKTVAEGLFTLVDDMIYFVGYSGDFEDAIGIYDINLQEARKTPIVFGELPDALFSVNNEVYFYKTTDNDGNKSFVLKKIVNTEVGIKTVLCAECKRDCSVGLYHNRLVYIASGRYDMYVFDFEKQSSYKVADQCFLCSYETDDEGERIEDKFEYEASPFALIGDWIYYRYVDVKNDCRKMYRVNINNPMNAVEIDMED